MFVPGFVLGLNYRMTKNWDLGAWYRWSDAVSARTELELTSLYWINAGTKNENPCPGDEPDCNKTIREDAGSLEFDIPMEAKIGVRYHHPLEQVTDRPSWSTREDRGYVRDPLSQDRFDVEVDLTWAHNSSIDNIEIRFEEGIDVAGTPGTVPVNADVPHNWKDVLGVRVGSEVTVLPNLLGVRGGGFFESKGQDDEFLNLDFHMGWKLGLSLGGVVRLGPVDIDLAYQHVFFGTLDNEGDGAVKGLSGDATTGFRTQQVVNGGSFDSSLNEIALGAKVRF
jgi:long-chain fatty acid transport protein